MSLDKDEKHGRKMDMESPGPEDRNRIVYFILVIHGIGTLLPWNMFITADNYFSYKLEGNDTLGNPLPYKDNFLSYVGIASKLPNVIVQLINFLVGGKSRSLTNRILVSVVLEGIIFAITTALAVIDSSQWIPGFFWVTMVSVVFINIWNGIYQNCIYGVVAVLPAQYLNVVVTGMNLSGVVSSFCMIISLAIAPTISATATAYFALAVVFLIACFVTYVMLLRNSFFKYYTARLEDTPVSDQEEAGIKDSPEKVKSYMIIFKQIWVQLFNVFFIYFVSLLLFPPVLARVPSITGFAGDYFGPVFCFLSFSLFGSLGNILIDYVPKVPAKYLWIPTLLRVLFIPFFLFCNFKGTDRTSIVLFGDWVYTIGVVVFATSTGYFSSLAIYYAPKLVSKEHASMAGMMSSFSLMMGIMMGIFSSLSLTQFS